MSAAEARHPPVDSHRRMAFIVVGVGASAGGLEAMRLLFGQLRRNGRVAYVVAQHMGNHTQADLVVRVIQRGATLPVYLGQDGQLIEADAVYVIPADCDGLVIEGYLKLQRRDTGRISAPCVDVLLQSLAERLGSRGWAVILSGTGRDGALGCRAVQQAGGSVVIQAPSEAGFAGMPEAALEPGGTSVTLRAGQIGAWIERKLSVETIAPEELETQANDLSPVIVRVREVTGIDFSGYRQETLWRRLLSRRNSLGLRPDAYERLLLEDIREAQQLQRMFLVSVSSFWRDRESFEALGIVLAQRMAAKPEGEPLRAWVAGCATGEEAYTLAALLSDLVERLGQARPVEIVATDLSHDALSVARSGEYLHKAFREAPQGWAERWFTPVAEGYRVGSELTSRVRFEQADVETEAFDGLKGLAMDLVSCRNLLIYFMRPKQDRVIARFRQALKPDGLLFLGSSEDLSPTAQTTFRSLDPEHRIYARRPR